MNRVSLTGHELNLAAKIGVDIACYNLTKGAEHKHGSPPEQALQMSIMGAIGELAFAKFLGEFWSGNMSDYKAKDVNGYQIRTTLTWAKNYSLILHPADSDDDIFVALAVDPSTYRQVEMRGWCRGREGKRDVFWRDDTTIEKPLRKGGDAFFVKQVALHPMSDLPKRLTSVR